MAAFSLDAAHFLFFLKLGDNGGPGSSWEHLAHNGETNAGEGPQLFCPTRWERSCVSADLPLNVDVTLLWSARGRLMSSTTIGYRWNVYRLPVSYNFLESLSEVVEKQIVGIRGQVLIVAI